MRENTYSSIGDSYQANSLADSLAAERGRKISQRSRNTSNHSLTTNIDGTLISGEQFFHTPQPIQYPAFFFNGADGAADNAPYSAGLDTYDYPYFPTKILLGTGVEFTRWAIDPSNNTFTTRDGGSITVIETNFISIQNAEDQIASYSSVEFSGFGGVDTQDIETNYGSAQYSQNNFPDADSGVKYSDYSTGFKFDEKIDDEMNWYSAIWNEGGTEGTTKTLLKARTVNHLLSGQFVPFTDFITSGVFNFENDVDTYKIPTTNTFRIRKEIPHNHSFGVSGAIKTMAITKNTGSGAVFADEAETEQMADLVGVEGTSYLIDKPEYRGVGRPCFIYFKRSDILIEKGDVALDGTGEGSTRDDFIETKITFKAELPEQAANEYYPYNGWLLKEIGLFADAKYNFREEDYASATQEVKDAYNKMPGGVMIAKRNIAPLFKHGNVSATIQWTLYF